MTAKQLQVRKEVQEHLETLIDFIDAIEKGGDRKFTWTEQPEGFEYWHRFREACAQVRKELIKTAIITIPSAQVPAPLTQAPENGELVFIANPVAENAYSEFYWDNSIYAAHALERGLVYLTSVEAVKRANAMIGGEA